MLLLEDPGISKRRSDLESLYKSLEAIHSGMCLRHLGQIKDISLKPGTRSIALRLEAIATRVEAITASNKKLLGWGGGHRYSFNPFFAPILDEPSDAHQPHERRAAVVQLNRPLSTPPATVFARDDQEASSPDTPNAQCTRKPRH